ncbi:N-acetyltransferase [Photobacterium sanctipauli]|uniref:N-acetyltransferase n=1 Tax=Photobacterium sanctipauli TaxID=1342794 RepID=A0A2T3NN60_9GAMM|nr:GNAT family N-acetyltransferase [Photobacterium sanctipauli]PSW16930.1 N-acetyltransferase [Photobacterium sanctipauli]
MTLTFRQARHSDLEGLVMMLANDPLGSKREDVSLPLNAKYEAAFKAIDTDPNNQLIVAETDGNLVGMLQLTFIPYLTHTGSWRCLVEGVRVHEDYRGRGYGEAFFEHAIATAKSKGCSLIQLTSDKARPDALRFYEKLGFTASHEGFKLAL